MMEAVVEYPDALTDKDFHYCPGCTHGITHRVIAEVIDELDIKEETIGVAPVGCSVLAYEYFDTDFQEASHGRAPAVATGIKRVHQDKTVFTYQGDGDLASIGTAEIVHAANRGENITTIFINNAVYGMTGGQMAPTTLEGQKTTTSPRGRDIKKAGNPIRVTEMLSELNGPAYLARVSMHDTKHIRQAKKSIKKAFKTQHAEAGFTMVEVLSNCPTNWGMSPKESLEWLEENMLPVYELGEFVDIGEVD